jgi:hypothetical protein
LLIPGRVQLEAAREQALPINPKLCMLVTKKQMPDA